MLPISMMLALMLLDFSLSYGYPKVGLINGDFFRDLKVASCSVKHWKVHLFLYELGQ
jgi:hypothetical protein